MSGIGICKAGVGNLERIVTPAEGDVLGVVWEVSNFYSKSAVEVEGEGEGEERLEAVDEERVVRLVEGLKRQELVG